jgi:hypothetical protein
MLQRCRFVLVAAILATLTATPALALDANVIDRWLESMIELKDWGEQSPDDVLEDMDDDDMDDSGTFDFERMLENVAGEHPQVRQIVRRHGFSAEEWASTGSRIFSAYLSLAMAEVSGEMQQDMAEALREIEQNPDLSPEQKQAMRQQMEQMARGQFMGGITDDVPEADLRAVRSRKAELDSFFGADG